MSQPPPSSPPDSGSSKRRIVYRPKDIQDIDYKRDIGDPGCFPYTRGIYPEMYRKRVWTFRQYAGYATAEDSNRRYHYLLSQGTRGLSVAFDLPTQIGLDSDHPLAHGEVGRVGVAIDSLQDMERLFEGIPLDQVSTSMTINATAPILLALYLALARRRHVPWKALRGTIQNDILKEYVARGTYIYPPRPALRLVTDVFEFCRREVPEWNTISVSGYHIREAGSTAAQEIGFTLANAETYVRAAVSAGLAIDQFAPRMSFFFNSHNDLLEEAAKFRAARRIWARLLCNEFQARDPRSCMLRFHAQTAGSTLTAQQTANNVVRVAYQALAAVLGGTQSLHTNAQDEALGLPTEETARQALRTQQILAHESGVADVVDPLGGSYYIEKLTSELEKEALDYMEKIRNMGGSLVAIESGFMQREIQESSFQQQQAFEAKERVVVGVNHHVDENRQPVEVLRIDPQVEARQRDRLEDLRRKRDQAPVSRAIEEIEKIARSDKNLLHPLISAVETGCTVGEISDALRRVFGEYREEIVI